MKRKVPIETQVTAKLWIRILRCSQAANFLFANIGIGEEFSEVLAAGSQQRHCIHIVDKDGNTLLTELGQQIGRAHV